MTRALIPMPGKGTVLAEVDVYRDEEAVVVRGRIAHSKEIPFGQVTTHGSFETRFSTIAAYDSAKARAFEKHPVLYAKAVGVLGLDDDARNAPPLPRLPPRRPIYEVDDGEGGVAIVEEAAQEPRAAAPRAPLLLAANDDERGS